MDCHLCTSSSSVVIHKRLLACKELVSLRVYPTVGVYSGLSLWPSRVHRYFTFSVHVLKEATMHNFQYWTVAHTDRQKHRCLWIYIGVCLAWQLIMNQTQICFICQGFLPKMTVSFSLLTIANTGNTDLGNYTFRCYHMDLVQEYPEF